MSPSLTFPPEPDPPPVIVWRRINQYFWENGILEVTVEIHIGANKTILEERGARRALETDLIMSRKPAFNVQGT